MKRNLVVSTSIAVAAVAALVAGCGSGDQNMPGMDHGNMPGMSHGNQPPAAGGQHNDVDVTFAQGMVPHHAQAIDMAKLAEQRAQSVQVKDLARQIEAAQGPEIATLNGWLQSWGVPAPQTSMPGMDHGGMDHGGMDHGGMDMGQGMMSQDDMQKLQQAQGPAFDRMFLEMMIKHHEGAVIMAQAEIAQGQFPDAKQMAQQIITTQQAEIGTMQNMLKQG